MRKVRRLLEPHSGLQSNFVLYWLHRSYGHLRQGKRLLMSSCDFLCFDSPRAAPRALRYMLKATGVMHGPIPSVDQVNMRPLAQYAALTSDSFTGAGPRSVAVKSAWTFGEILMEPLSYNPYLAGWWGHKVLDSPAWLRDDRDRHREVRLVRSSPQRLQRARGLYDVSVQLADAGLTHVVHLLSLSGGLHLRSYRELRSDLGRTPRFTRATYDSLLEALPPVWLQIVTAAASLHAQHLSWDMPTLIRRIPPPPNVWVQLPSGLVGKVEARPATILHCFSGRAHREDGLAAALTSRGLECAEVDTVIHSKRHDLLDDDVYDTLCQAAQAGEFQAGVFGVPCSTFSVARIPDPTATPAHPTGPTCVRGRDATDRHGLPGLDASQHREVYRANELMRRSVHLATLIHGKGGAVVFENPPDRGCADSPDSVVRGLYEPKFANHNFGTIYGFSHTYSLPISGAGSREPKHLNIVLPNG